MEQVVLIRSRTNVAKHAQIYLGAAILTWGFAKLLCLFWAENHFKQTSNKTDGKSLEHRSPFSWLFLIWGEQGLFVSAGSVLNHVWIKSSFRFTYWYRAKEGNYILQSIRFRDWLSFFSFDSSVQKALRRFHDNFSDLTEGKEHTRMLN